MIPSRIKPRKSMHQMKSPLPGIRGRIPSHEDPDKLDFLTRYQEDGCGEVFGTAEGEVFSSIGNLNLEADKPDSMNTPRMMLLHNLDVSSQPSSGETHAPLSEAGYTETNATQMDFEDLEDLDNIFGADESGICHINDKLIQKQKQNLAKAEEEERQYQERWSSKHNFASESTLVSIQQSAYNVDSGRSAEDDARNTDQDPGIKTDLHGALDHSNRGLMAPFSMPKQIRPKASLPAFSSSKPNIRRFKSTVGFAISENANFDKSIDDEVNYNTDIKRKLERIPSFYRTKNSTSTNSLLHDRKSQVLRAYREPEFMSPVRAKMGHVKGYTGLSKQLPQYTNMKFDASKNQWMGNEIDLVRFEATHPTAGRVNDPSRRSTNMVYDEMNMRWVNIDEENSNGEHDAIFENIPDLNSPIKRLEPAPRQREISANRHGLEQHSMPRMASSYTQRTISSMDTHRAAQPRLEFEFEFLTKQLERFEREAEKLARKTAHWFLELEIAEGQPALEFSRAYLYDIRNMVIENR